MKRIIMRLAALMVATNITSAVHAQELPTCPPFVQEGKVWEVERYRRSWLCDEWGRVKTSRPTEFFTCTYIMHGDTLVGGRVMKRVYRNDSGFYGDEDDHYFAAVREEGSRVFIVYADSVEEFCLYDFRPEGECEGMAFTGLWNRNVVDCPLNFDMTVERDLYDDEDTLIINDCKTRRFFMYATGQFHNCPNMYFIENFSGELAFNAECLMLEGFGNVHTDPFDVSVWIDESYSVAEAVVRLSKPYTAHNYVEVPACVFYGPGTVKHVYLDGTRIASSWDFSGGSTVVESLQTEECNPVLYDLQGRRLTHEPARGMYIRDGRKYLKR